MPGAQIKWACVDDFEQQWWLHFGQTPPVGWRLRDSFQERWARFHALPESKRYAHTDAERAIILRRANTLASEVLGLGQACWLVANTPIITSDEIGLISGVYTINKKALSRHFGWVDLREGREDQRPWAAYYKQFNWTPGLFDDVFAKIAIEQEANVIWVSADMTSVFAPYDGGFDLILPTAEKISKLKKTYDEWRPIFGGDW